MIDALWVLIEGAWEFVSRIAPTVVAALIAAVAALIGYGHVKARELADAHRPQKMQVYEHFLSIVRYM